MATSTILCVVCEEGHETGEGIEAVATEMPSSASSKWQKLKYALTRKKVIDDASFKSKLAKCLTTVDLAALSVASSLGVGVYVIAGDVARTHAGPAVIVSFLIAAVASLLAGLCFAEFGTRVPKAGSSYVYTYVTIGEFLAFIIGWILILEYVIGAASVVRGLSSYIDEFTGQAISNAFKSIIKIEVAYLSPYIDFLAFGITVVFSVALALGAKESSVANNVCTFFNLLVVSFVIIAGLFKADIANWRIDAEKLPKKEGYNYGAGGFAPFGIMGILSGASECFYGLIGFDCIASAGEEAKNPKKSIPLSIITSLIIVFLAYFGISSVLTTVVPYYDQNTKAPFIHMFESVGWDWAAHVVTFGAFFGLTASLVGALFPLPRIIYAMATDGLLYRWLGNVNTRFQTPMTGTLLAGVCTGIIAAIFDVNQLVKMASVGTLFSYSIVAACVLILRYSEDKFPGKTQQIEEPWTARYIATQLINAGRLTSPTKLTSTIVSYLVTIFVGVSFLCAAFIRIFSDSILNVDTWAVFVLGTLIVCMVALLLSIHKQPTSCKLIPFAVPLVPFLPAASIFINFQLVCGLNALTWAQFVIWMIIGLIVYFTHGIKHSTNVQRPKPILNGETYQLLDN